MGLFSFLRRSSDDDDDRTDIGDPLHDFWYNLIGGTRRPGGQLVTADTAGRVAAVFACITAIAESIAMVPFKVVKYTDDRTTKAEDKHPLWKLLHDSPNSFMDSFEFFEAMQRQALEYGNAYAFVSRSRAGEIGEIIPLDSTRMQIKVEGTPGAQTLVFIYAEGNSTSRKFTQSEIFHFKPYSRDGLVGRTPIQVASDTVAFSLALLQHGNSLFENGAFHSGFVEAPHTFENDEARKNFMNSFKQYFGAKNAGKVALLEQGVQFKPASMNARDSQFLESKEFGAVEIARLFRMPPVMIQAMDKGMAFASVEQLAIMFVQHTIQPWATRWERAIKRQLIGFEADAAVYPKFNLNALLRGDMLARTQSIVQQLQYGLMTINEGRALEDRNPIEEEIGDKPLLSHNLRPADEPAPPIGQAPGQAPIEPEKDDKEDPGEPKPETKAAAFTPLFRSLLARYVKKAREKGAAEMRKLISDALEPAVAALLGISDTRDVTLSSSVAVNMFLTDWVKEQASLVKREETEEQELERRTQALLGIAGAASGLNAPAQQVVNVTTGPNVIEFKAAPKEPESFRLRYKVVDGQREAIISRE